MDIEDDTYENAATLRRLKQAYIDSRPDSFGLFLGAGVNLHPDRNAQTRFAMYGWPALLEEIYLRNAGRYAEPYAALSARYGEDWPGLAEALLGPLDTETWVEQLDAIFYGGSYCRIIYTHIYINLHILYI